MLLGVPVESTIMILIKERTKITALNIFKELVKIGSGKIMFRSGANRSVPNNTTNPQAYPKAFMDVLIYFHKLQMTNFYQKVDTQRRKQ